VVTPAHKFDLRLVTQKKHLINGERYLLKKKLRDAVIGYLALDRIYTFSSDIRGRVKGLSPRREVQDSLE
jgi:hypothetical protein